MPMPLRFGIKSKLVGTLVLAGLLPLLVSLGVLVSFVFNVRIDSVGTAFRAAARQEASHLETLLSSQIEFTYLLSRLPGTTEFLKELAELPPPTDKQIAAIEAQWGSIGPDAQPLRAILNNPIAARWRAVRQQRVRFAEVLITDARGRLVAATNKTSDYDQADETWWQECAQAADGEVRLADVEWDESAVSITGQRGAPVLSLCMPMFGADEAAPGATGPLLGVMKVSIDTAWLSQQLHTDVLSGYTEPKVGLIHESGIPVGLQARPAGAPGGEGAEVAAMVSPEAMRMMRQTGSGWIISRETGDDVIGYATVDLPEGRLDVLNDPDWYVVVAVSRNAALAPLYRLVWLIVGAGLASIAVCFVGGVFIARREVIRPLLALRQGAAELGRGNINYRLPVDGDSALAAAGIRPQFRDDEIGQLARDFNKMADRLRDVVQELERASLLKQQFIDVASHELRTPVAYILGMAQLGAKGNGSPLMAKILPKAKRLGRIIDNMFKLVQSGSYGATLNRGMVDLRALIDTAVQDVQPFAQERDQTVDMSIAADLPPIEADADKIRDVLSNLLSNAVRFSPDGTTVRVEARPLDSTAVEIAVSDAGPGIPPEDVPRLFEPFYPPAREGVMHHTSGEYAHGTRGIGLGLSVVKRFVDLHGGTVMVETGDTGTTMRIRLPRRIGDTIELQDAAAAI